MRYQTTLQTGIALFTPVICHLFFITHEPVKLFTLNHMSLLSDAKLVGLLHFLYLLVASR